MKRFQPLITFLAVAASISSTQVQAETIRVPPGYEGNLCLFVNDYSGEIVVNWGTWRGYRELPNTDELKLISFYAEGNNYPLIQVSQPPNFTLYRENCNEVVTELTFSGNLLNRGRGQQECECDFPFSFYTLEWTSDQF